MVTADMASHMMVWAEIGRPNQREWLPNKKYDFDGDDGLYPSGYYLFGAEPSATLRASIEQNEKVRMADSAGPDSTEGCTGLQQGGLYGPTVEGLAIARFR